MGLIDLLVIVLVLAIVFWLLTQYILPVVPEPWRRIIVVILALIVVLWLLSQIGVLNLRL